jgi:hypothetical protein
MAGEPKGGFTRTVAKRAFAPLAHAAVTAGTAYLTRRAMRLWQEKIQPKIEERGGGRSIAKETIQTVAEKAGATGATSSSSREADRRGREQRRNQRRSALEKSGSS